MSFIDPAIEPAEPVPQVTTTPKPETGLCNNFQIQAQYSLQGPAYQYPQPEAYPNQQITAEINGQELLHGCENAGMLPDTQLKIIVPEVGGSVASDLFGAACNSVSQPVAEVKANFLQPTNVPVTELNIETPVNRFNPSLTPGLNPTV